MKKINRRSFLELTAAANATLLAGSLVGCAADESSSTAASSQSIVEQSTDEETEFSYPMQWTGDPIKLFAQEYFYLNPVYESGDVSIPHMTIEKLTGLDLDWSFPTAGVSGTEALNMTLARTDLPSGIGGVNLTDVEMFMNEGLLLNLIDYLPIHAPNYWAFLQDPANDYHRKCWTTDAGQIGVFGNYREGDFGATFVGPMVRKDILDAEGLDLPTTMDDWDNVLKVMYEKYDLKMSFEMRYASPFLSSGCDAFGTFSMTKYLDNGEVKIAQLQPEWKTYMQKLADWYDKGYIDSDIFTNGPTEVASKVASNKVGAICGAMSRLTAYISASEQNANGHNWVGVPFPSAVKGEKPVTGHRVDIVTYIGMGITTQATEEEVIALCRFYDWFFTPEGNEYMNWGEEGVSYNLVDGKHVWTDKIYKDGVFLPEGEAYLASYGGPHIGMQQTDRVKAGNHPTTSDAAEQWSQTGAKDHFFPTSVSYTVDEMSAKSSKENAISTYIEECALKFLIGDMDINTEYDSFVSEINEMGVNDVLSVYQTGYDRYAQR